MDGWRSALHNAWDRALDGVFRDLVVDPKTVSWTSLLLSIVVYMFFAVGNKFWAVIFLSLVLLLDSIDGYMARKMKKSSFDGLVLDTATDRLSEFLVFYPSPFWLLLAAANTFLSVVRLKGYGSILPLRQIFLTLHAIGLLFGYAIVQPFLA